MDAPIASVSSAGGSSRQVRRRKWRKLLVDPLAPFSTSADLGFCPFSIDLAEDGQRLKERIRVTSGISNACLRSISPSRAERFVTDRAALLDDLSHHNRACRETLRKLVSSDSGDQETLERLGTGVADFDLIVSTEREAIFRDRVRLEMGILSQRSPALIGQAYLAALAEYSVQSTDPLQRHEDRTKIDFANQVVNLYTPAKESPEYDAPEELGWRWCPVTHAWHRLSSMTVLQIVPYTIGECNTSLVFGLRQDEGWKALWGFENGMVLVSDVCTNVREDRLVIVPDGESADGLKLVVLDDSLLDQAPYPDGPPYRDLHNTNLMFKTAIRPLKRNLFFRCLMTTFRRHHHGALGHENDSKKIQPNKVWKSYGRLMEESAIRKLTMEVDDFWES